MDKRNENLPDKRDENMPDNRSENPIPAENVRICKKCLLRDMADADAYKSVKEYVDKIPGTQKATDAEYARRLKICAECSELLSGTCLVCGCYVEIRAAGKNAACPLKKKKW